MSKCILCGNELLSGDIHWEQGLCNQCYKKTEKPDPFWNIIVDRRKLDIREKYIEKLEQENKELKQQLDKAEQELAFYKDEIKNRGTCGLCEKLENEQIKKLQQQLAEKDKAFEIACEYLESILDESQVFIPKYHKESILEQAKENIDGTTKRIK